VSCWADASSARYAESLAAGWLAGVRLQPKGLIATEAFVSLPLAGAPAPVLALRSHFFEFLPCTDWVGPAPGADARLAHELEAGRRYEIVVTTGGGLYRYRTGDLVEVVGHHGAAPCLRFVGRAGLVSDLCGEKLSEPFVAGVLATALDRLGLTPVFVLLAPEATPGGTARYTLFLERPSRDGREASELGPRLAAAVDDGLRASFHYDHCRRLGQLGPVRVRWVVDGAARQLAFRRARGQRLGDVKPGVLEPSPDWAAVATRGVL
jgi:hypothetical protein